MANDVLGIQRVVAAYSKTPNEFGSYYGVTEYKLKPIDLEFLQRLFNINPLDPDYGIRDLIDCYQINHDQAKALQPYVIDGVIDLDKYDFMLECYQA